EGIGIAAPPAGDVLAGPAWTLIDVDLDVVRRGVQQPASSARPDDDRGILSVERGFGELPCPRAAQGVDTDHRLDRRAEAEHDWKLRVIDPRVGIVDAWA